MRDALVDLPGMRAVTVLSDYDADVNHYLNWFRAGTLIFGGFGYILTLAVLFNTVNGGLRERHDELAILRALGSSRREIALLVTLELLAMVVLGAVIGVPVGRAMGFWLTHTYDTDFFGQVNVLRPHYYVVGLLSLVIVVLLAELPGLRAVQRADLGQISKSQSF
jgi:putative ABC transport system permease protein